MNSSVGRNLGLVIALVVLIIIGVATAGDRFASVDNMLTILRFASVIGVVSIGMTFVIIGGGIDLSVGAIVALASVWATTLATDHGGEHPLARHGVGRVGRGHRLRCGQRHLDRLRQNGAVHRHAGYARGTRPGRDHLRTQDPDRGRPGVRRLLWRGLSRDPGWYGSSPWSLPLAGFCSTGPHSDAERFLLVATQLRPALLVSMSSGTRCSSTCSWASPAASPQS